MCITGGRESLYHGTLADGELIGVVLVVFAERFGVLFEDDFKGRVRPGGTGGQTGLLPVKVLDPLGNGDIRAAVFAGGAVTVLNEVTDKGVEIYVQRRLFCILCLACIHK